MKNLKKVCGMFLALTLTSCTSLNTQRVFDGIGDIFNGGNRDTGELVEIGNFGTDILAPKAEKGSEILTEKIVEEKEVLKSSNVKSYLDEIKNRLKGGEKLEVLEKKSTYEILVGKYLVLPLNGETKVKVETAPKNTTPRAKISNNKLYFRTIYRGDYTLNLYSNGSLTRKINIIATSKNNFSEKNMYDIILENSSKNNKTLKDAVTLYKIYYPNGKNYKNVSYQLLKYGYVNKNNRIMNEALGVLKSDISSFSDEEKRLILEAATLTNKRVYIPQNIYETSNKDLQNSLAKYINNKDIKDKKDIIFMKNNFPDVIEKTLKNEKETVEEVVNNISSEAQSLREDTEAKAKEQIKIEKVKVEKAKEEIKSKAKKKVEEQIKVKKEVKREVKKIEGNINSIKPKVQGYKKRLSQAKSKDKKADIYYNLMQQYVKSGNRIKALRYLSLIKQSSKDKDLIRRAQAEVNAMR